MINTTIIGASGAGKSTFILRHLTGHFVHNYADKIDTKLEFFTNYGEIVYNVVEQNTLPTTRPHALFIMFDKTNVETVQFALTLVKDAREKFGETIPIILIGSKTDIPKIVEPKKLYTKIRQAIKAFNVVYFDISAKSCYNFEKPFLYAMRVLIAEDIFLQEEKVTDTMYNKLEAELGNACQSDLTTFDIVHG